MQYNLLQQPISHDFVPYGSHCEWCGKEAVEQLTALGGLHHNQSGRFCPSCGRAFMKQVHAHTASSVVLGVEAMQELSSFYPLDSYQKTLRLVNAIPDEEILVTGNQSLWLCRLH
jgi:hypothetical protein